MKFPLIGMNMDYTCYPDYPATDPQFRDCYDIYAPYVDVVSRAGGVPLLAPCLENERVLEKYIARADGFVFTGGEDYSPEYYGEVPAPETKVCCERRARSDIKLARLALATGMPVLGICGGLQLINIAAGGKLIQHLETVETHKAPSYTRDAAHPVLLAADSLLASVLRAERIVVNSAHHQAVHPAHIGAGLRVTAQAEDGVIEALESAEKRFLIAVQWHPERLQDEDHRSRLFGAFIRACARSLDGDIRWFTDIL